MEHVIGGVGGESQNQRYELIYLGIASLRGLFGFLPLRRLIAFCYFVPNFQAIQSVGHFNLLTARRCPRRFSQSLTQPSSRPTTQPR
jgi:hypothetical protein